MHPRATSWPGSVYPATPCAVIQFSLPPLEVTTKNFWKGRDHSRQKRVMNRLRTKASGNQTATHSASASVFFL